MAGFLAAFRLWEEGKQVTLLEADKLFYGTTGKSTAKISCNQEVAYYVLYEKYGETAAKNYYSSQKYGRKKILELIEKYKIDCDLKEAASYIFAYDDCDLKQNFRLLKKFGADCGLCEIDVGGKTRRALKMNGEYMFDPLKFLSGLPAQFEIFEHTRAVDIDCDKKIIRTDGGNVVAENIIIATHYPIINTHGGYILKLRQSESYLAATDATLTDDMYLDLKNDGLTVRPYTGGTIIGGGDHRTGRREKADRLAILRGYAKERFGTENLTHFWNAEDVMTADGMPCCGKYWAHADGIYVITGFNKWGMTNSAVCADIICDTLLGRENAYASLFSPQRRIRGGIADYAINAVTTLTDVILGYFRITSKSVYDIPQGRGAVVRYNGKKRAVYRDNNDKLYVIGSMCPHMHGELKWNASANCWECPCHGSRFDKYGNIINEPATKCCKCRIDEI